MFTKKTVREIDLTGKRVLMRADYNVPVTNGVITDYYRIKQTVPTIRYILEQHGTRLVIVSHLGRPKGPEDKEYSLEPVARILSKLLSRDVQFVPDCVGDVVKKAVSELEPGGILLLENVRFHPEEEKNDTAFAKSIVEATGAEVFVQDGFGVVHRAHATTEAIARLMPAVAGLLVEKEVDTITHIMQDPPHPLVAVVGGSKVSDKIAILNRLIDIADCVAIGGAMTNNFLAAEGIAVGGSLLEKEALDITRQILQKARAAEKDRSFNFLVPVDVVVSTVREGKTPTRVVDVHSHSLADINAYPKLPEPPAYTVGADEMILDVGPISAGYISGAIKMAKTVIWNGTLGVTEIKGIGGAHDPFAHATRMVIDAMIGASNRHQNKPFTLVGGGDTAGYVENEGLVEDFSHVSTGGGATLDLMAGKNLPGIEVLWNKQG